MLQKILEAYGINEAAHSITPVGSGLIHKTWKLIDGERVFILQQINHNVFHDPYAIAENTEQVARYLREHHSTYLFVAPIPTKTNENVFYSETEGYYRLFPFVKGSHSIDSVSTIEQAYEAAKQFGRFTGLLAGFNTENLKITIPDFHNLTFRYRQFLKAVENGDEKRKEHAKQLTKELISYQSIATAYEQIKLNPDFQQRVTHHDTKISNVLFNDQNRALCVIDLDTMMPGYFLSDVGDMMRTYLSPANEEETNFSLINIREEYFRAIVTGYLEEMNGHLTPVEKKHFVYAGKYIIYMQALRFLTDYLNNDVYYGARYELHNYNRALNQMHLLQELINKESHLENIVRAATEKQIS